jgi:hypothetical protein
VTTDRKITVAAWIDSQDPVPPPNRAHRRFLPPALLGLAGTLLLHGLVLQTVVLGSRAHKTPPEIRDPGSLLSQSAGNPAESLVFVDLPNTAKADNPMVDAIALARAAIKDTPIVVSPPDPPPLPTIEILALNDDKDSQSADSGDGMDHARLFGIYSGQIQARIERIWRRPRTPVEEGSNSAKNVNSVDYFHCQVQIVQDSSGNVQEVLLPNCNGSVTWQRSLILAIQQASPLPAPPSASVFSHSISLNFLGLPYVPGSPEDDYEIVPLKKVQALSTVASSRPSGPRFVPGPPVSQSPDSASDLR